MSTRKLDGTLHISTSDLSSINPPQISESFKEISKTYEKYINSLDINFMTENMSSITASIAKQFSSIDYKIDLDPIFESLNDISAPEYLSIIENTSRRLEENWSKLDISHLAKYLAKPNKKFDYETINKYYEEYLCKEDDFDEITTDEIVAVLQDPVGLQEELYNKADNAKKKYWIIFIILHVIFQIFILPALQDTGKTITSKLLSRVRQEPNTTSEIVTTINTNQTAIIIENNYYYYKIELTEENGEIKKGYVSKRSVEILKEEEEK